MASGVVDICLIPEVKFNLQGSFGLLSYLETVLSQRGHAVICMAEGAGQVRSNKDLTGQMSLYAVDPDTCQLRACLQC